jgi:hypothetical protein
MDDLKPWAFVEWCYHYSKCYQLRVQVQEEEVGIEGAPFKMAKGFFQEIQKHLNRRLELERAAEAFPQKPLCVHNDACRKLYGRIERPEDDIIFIRHCRWIHNGEEPPVHDDQEIRRRNMAVVERLTQRLIEFAAYEDCSITYVRNNVAPIEGLSHTFPIYVESRPNGLPHETAFPCINRRRMNER